MSTLTGKTNVQQKRSVSRASCEYFAAFGQFHRPRRNVGVALVETEIGDLSIQKRSLSP